MADMVIYDFEPPKFAGPSRWARAILYIFFDTPRRPRQLTAVVSPLPGAWPGLAQFPAVRCP
jgi:hypothetical protein